MLMLLEFNPSAPAYLPQGAGEGSGGCRTAQVHSDHRRAIAARGQRDRRHSPMANLYRLETPRGTAHRSTGYKS
jgi:hypothetical protein